MIYWVGSRSHFQIPSRSQQRRHCFEVEVEALCTENYRSQSGELSQLKLLKIISCKVVNLSQIICMENLPVELLKIILQSGEIKSNNIYGKPTCRNRNIRLWCAALTTVLADNHSPIDFCGKRKIGEKQLLWWPKPTMGAQK